MIGKIYNNWQILEENGLRVKCKCVGCNSTEKILDKYDVIYSRTKSCGCQRQRLTIETSIQRYGTSYYTQTKEYKQRQEKTNLLRYGVKHNFEIEGVRKENAKKSKKTRKEQGDLHLLPDGSILAERCLEVGANYSHALTIYNIDAQLALDYLNRYTGPHVYGTTELVFINLLKDHFPIIKKYDKAPQEFSSRNRPDFRLEHNNKVLYVNTDGLYDHSSSGRLCKNGNGYHLNLQAQFASNNQILFQFREDELRDKGEIVKSIVLNYFGMLDKKYQARKLEIREVPYQDSKEFFEKNHLMGSYRAKAYGLYDQEELICCLSFKLKKEILDISRFASKNFCSVAGGFSRLLTFIIKKHNPSKIESFCDLRYSTGKSYEKLEFKLESIRLGWKWTDFHNTYNRLRCRANMDKRGLSEAEYAKELRWCKIYDAGQAKYTKAIR